MTGALAVAATLDQGRHLGAECDLDTASGFAANGVDGESNVLREDAEFGLGEAEARRRCSTATEDYVVVFVTQRHRRATRRATAPEPVWPWGPQPHGVAGTMRLES